MLHVMIFNAFLKLGLRNLLAGLLMLLFLKTAMTIFLSWNKYINVTNNQFFKLYKSLNLFSSLSCDVDVNECDQDTHDCDQICVNLVGNYTCECRNGYVLMGKTTCEGKVDVCESISCVLSVFYLMINIEGYSNFVNDSYEEANLKLWYLHLF